MVKWLSEATGGTDTPDSFLTPRRGGARRQQGPAAATFEQSGGESQPLPPPREQAACCAACRSLAGTAPHSPTPRGGPRAAGVASAGCPRSAPAEAAAGDARKGAGGCRTSHKESRGDARAAAPGERVG